MHQDKIHVCTFGGTLDEVNSIFEVQIRRPASLWKTRNFSFQEQQQQQQQQQTKITLQLSQQDIHLSQSTTDMAEILSSGSGSGSTDVAAITWLTASGSQQTRVYHQDDSGNIREQMCSDGAWSPGNGGRPLTSTSIGSRITANYWYQDNQGGDQIRVYFTTRNGGIQEWCYVGNKGWFEGQTVV